MVFLSIHHVKLSNVGTVHPQYYSVYIANNQTNIRLLSDHEKADPLHCCKALESSVADPSLSSDAKGSKVHLDLQNVGDRGAWIRCARIAIRCLLNKTAKGVAQD